MWLASEIKVGKGVVVGEDTVVASRSIVLKDIPLFACCRNASCCEARWGHVVEVAMSGLSLARRDPDWRRSRPSVTAHLGPTPQSGMWVAPLGRPTLDSVDLKETRVQRPGCNPASPVRILEAIIMLAASLRYALAPAPTQTISAPTRSVAVTLLADTGVLQIDSGGHSGTCAVSLLHRHGTPPGRRRMTRLDLPVIYHSRRSVSAVRRQAPRR